MFMVYNILMVFIILLVLGYILAVFVVTKFLGRLSPQFSSYYDFGKYLPGSGKFVFVLYLIFIIVVIIALLVFAQINLKVIPA